MNDCHFGASPVNYSETNNISSNIFGHKFFICKSIFKIFAADFTTNLDLDIGKKAYSPKNSFLGVNFNTIIPKSDKENSHNAWHTRQLESTFMRSASDVITLLDVYH